MKGSTLIFENENGANCRDIEIYPLLPSLSFLCQLDFIMFHKEQTLCHSKSVKHRGIDSLF